MIKLKTIFALIGIVFSITQAQTLLCLAETAAGVSINSGGQFNSSLINPESIKFIMKNNEGVWTVSKHGAKGWKIICMSEYHCSGNVDYYIGTFLKTNEDIFSVFWNGGSSDITTSWSYVAKGKCSEL